MSYIPYKSHIFHNYDFVQNIQMLFYNRWETKHFRLVIILLNCCLIKLAQGCSRKKGSVGDCPFFHFRQSVNFGQGQKIAHCKSLSSYMKSGKYSVLCCAPEFPMRCFTLTWAVRLPLQWREHSQTNNSGYSHGWSSGPELFWRKSFFPSLE